MPIVDASSILRAWDDYPVAQFPGFWRWIEAQVRAKRWIVCRMNLDEIERKSPECGAWLKARDVRVLPVTQAVANEALAIRRALGIETDGYHQDGVDEGDVILIATSKVEGMECVSDEGVQPIPPQNRRKYKIPAVCAMPTISVPCSSLVKVVRAAGVVFDDFE